MLSSRGQLQEQLTAAFEWFFKILERCALVGAIGYAAKVTKIAEFSVLYSLVSWILVLWVYLITRQTFFGGLDRAQKAATNSAESVRLAYRSYYPLAVGIPLGLAVRWIVEVLAAAAAG